MSDDQADNYLRRRIDDKTLELIALAPQMEQIHSDLKGLSDTVKDGMKELRMLFKEDMKEVKADLETAKKTIETQGRAVVRLQVYMAIIGSVCALTAGALLSALLPSLIHIKP